MKTKLLQHLRGVMKIKRQNGEFNISEHKNSLGKIIEATTST